MKIKIALCGIGGYGNLYVDALLDNMVEQNIDIVGIVEPFPDGCRRLAELQEKNISFYANLESFYKENFADLVVIASPIHFHKEQTCVALANGSNVLCEKPLAASLEDVEEMKKVRDESDCFLAVGFQWSYNPSILSLKRDILRGVFGKAKSLKTIVLWPRDETYYKRKWAGKIKDESGKLALDSVASNATAHYLHNMFFVLGDNIDSSEFPQEIMAEVFRANKIENFDTISLKIKTVSGVNINFYASHAVIDSYGPVFEYEFENAIIRYEEKGYAGSIKAFFKSGLLIEYGEPNNNRMKKLWDCIESVRTKKNLVTCPLEAALPHMICIEDIYKSSKIRTFSPEITLIDEESQITWVRGLGDSLLSCYSNGSRLSDSFESSL